VSALQKPIVAALGYLLTRESWARERLRPHAGAVVCIDGGPLLLKLRIDEHGMLAACEAAFEPNVTLTLPADAPLRLLLNRQSLFAGIRLAGSADIAEALAFVFRNLRWDVEEDLARVVGDIPARRLNLVGQRLVKEIGETGRRLTANLAEYVSEEAQFIVPAREVSGFASEIDRLRDDLARLEKRVQRLG
jgi:ubiquinone biosynthesis accessory factor UbiJ